MTKASNPHSCAVEKQGVEGDGSPGFVGAWLWAQLSTRRDVPFAVGDARIKK